MLFFLLDISCELVKFYSKNSINFVFVALAIFIIGWAIVFFKNDFCRNRRPRNKQNVTLFTYVMLAWSVCMTFDVTIYFLENNIFSKYYFLAIGAAFMFLGWIYGRLDNMHTKIKKKRN